jgi:hypothetical protein
MGHVLASLARLSSSSEDALVSSMAAVDGLICSFRSFSVFLPSHHTKGGGKLSHDHAVLTFFFGRKSQNDLDEI